MICPHCGALLYRRSGERILLVCRKPWISAHMADDRAVVTVIMDCLACRQQVRIVDLEWELTAAFAERIASGCPERRATSETMEAGAKTPGIG